VSFTLSSEKLQLQELVIGFVNKKKRFHETN